MNHPVLVYFKMGDPGDVPNGLHSDALYNFSMSVRECEEMISDSLNPFRL